MTNNQETNTIEIEKAFEEWFQDKYGEAIKWRDWQSCENLLTAKTWMSEGFTAGARSRDAYIQLLKDTREMADKEVEKLKRDLKWALDTINHIWEIERAPLDFDGERALKIRAKHGLDKEEV